jgi:hypothetical protein
MRLIGSFLVLLTVATTAQAARVTLPLRYAGQRGENYRTKKRSWQVDTSARVGFEAKDGELRIEMRDWLGGWSQKFVVSSDLTNQDGERRIEYVRPSPGSNMAKDNLRALNGLGRFLGLGWKSIDSGGGTLVVSKDGAMEWSNRGEGMYKRLPFGKPGRKQWDEKFQGWELVFGE